MIGQPETEVRQASGTQAGPTHNDEAVARWFLLADQRGNPATGIDRRHVDGRAWTEGNHVRALVHGARYFARLHACLSELAAGDRVYFTDWRGDPGQRLRGAGTELATLLAGLVDRGIAVRGLVWRSHPDQGKFSEQENQELGKRVNEAGGEVLMDERVRRAGCHHQKLVLLQHIEHPDDDVAFVGGSISATAEPTTSIITEIPRRSHWTSVTVPGPLGMTFSSRSADLPSETSPRPSENAGRTPHRSITRTLGGCIWPGSARSLAERDPSLPCLPIPARPAPSPYRSFGPIRRSVLPSRSLLRESEAWPART